MLFSQEPSGATLLGLSALAGLVFHHAYARRVEIDFYVWSLLGLAAVQGLVIVLWAVNIWQVPFPAALYILVKCMLSFSASLVGSILIYRGYFHRTGKFPGPVAARFSSLWTVRKSSGEFKFHQRLSDVHSQYGDFVRIGPRLVSITRAEALPQLMALGKGVWWSHTGSDHTKQSFSLSRVPEDHKQRRRPWELGFSERSIERFDPDVQEIIGIFLQQAEEQEVVSVPAAMGRLSFDITGLVGFGRSFESSSRQVAHPGLVAMRKAHYVLGSLRWMPWLMYFLSKLPGGGSDFVPFLDLCAGVVHDRQARYRAEKASGIDGDEDRKDVMAHVLEAMDEGGPGANSTAEALENDSRAMIAAATDTTQSALANALWFLAAEPALLQRFQKVLDKVFPGGADSFTYAKLIGNNETLEWVDAIIHETLRLRPSGISGNPRVTNPEGLLIPESEFGPEVFIPGDVDVLAPTWVIHRDERWFARPLEFLPERWLQGSTIHTDRNGFFPFNIGMMMNCAKIADRS
ncbi:hypothetical protein TruAng_011709 [Truncatella angustata]|nr:hypothetical protein TruAng_011709 [Truncatella angustata]